MKDKEMERGEEKIVYQGKIIEVVQQGFGTGKDERIFEFARRSPGTRLIIPTQDRKFLVTKEFRHELNDYDYRLPGGKVFDTLKEYNQFLKLGDDILGKAKIAAAKEALEEVGIIVKDMVHFSTSKAGATVVWDLFYFVVTEYEKHESGQHLERGENIEVMEITRDEAREICLDGRMKEDRSVAAVLRFLDNHH